jgi:ABC-type lipoprotein release transport system permease subunit
VIKLRIAAQNVIKHSLSTAVLVIIFAAAGFVLYWSFGFCNFVIAVINDFSRDSYGDVAFLTEYAEAGRVRELLQFPAIEKIVCEREIAVLFDNPENSAMSVLVELTPENRSRLYRYIRPVAGRLPEKPDEILITNFKQEGVYKIGDRLFATTATPQKIINALEYTVVGIARTTGFKAFGYGFMVTGESMDRLLNSSTQVNLVYLFLKDGFQKKQPVEELRGRVLRSFASHGIQVKDSWTTVERNEKMSIFSLTVIGVRLIVLCILFALVGAVIAAAVWIYAFKRRREIWTYVSLGMKDRDIMITFILEYWIISAIGSALGGSIGYASSLLADAANIWLTFSYTVTTPLRAQLGWADSAAIGLFVLVTVFIWIQIPLRRIIRAVPFSY